MTTTDFLMDIKEIKNSFQWRGCGIDYYAMTSHHTFAAVRAFGHARTLKFAFAGLSHVMGALALAHPVDAMTDSPAVQSPGSRVRRSPLSRFVDFVLHRHESPRSQTANNITEKLKLNASHKKALPRLVTLRLGRQGSSSDKENKQPRDYIVEPASTWHAGQVSPSSGKAPAYTLGLAAHDFGEPCNDCGAVVARRMYALARILFYSNNDCSEYYM